MAGQPMPSSFDEDEKLYGGTPMQRFARKLKKEPLIPLGSAATIAALVGAALSVRRGDRYRTQIMFRYRVAFQAFTVLAIFGGGWFFAEDRKRERAYWKRERSQQDEEKRQRWLAELEARDAEDKAVAARMALRRQRAAERGLSSSRPTAATAADGGPGSGPGTGTEAVSIKARAAMAKAKEQAREATTQGAKQGEEEAAEAQEGKEAAPADAEKPGQGVMGSVLGTLGYKTSTKKQGTAEQEQAPANAKGEDKPVEDVSMPQDSP